MVPRPVSPPSGYGMRLLDLLKGALRQLVRPPSHSRRAEAGRALARHTLALTAIAGAGIIALMFVLDAAAIGWMPVRGTASLWPLRVITEFGKDDYVLGVLLVLLIAVALAAPRLRGIRHAILIDFGTRLQFVFIAVLLPTLIGDVLKGLIGRGRPFVGGQADAFHYSHFAWTGSYASFPSGHAITAFSLAFAVAALWPPLRGIMIAYALIIATTRLVLLAHHPSDVLAGALVGVGGAMAVRYWFAARRLGFIILADGSIVARQGPSPATVIRAARTTLA